MGNCLLTTRNSPFKLWAVACVLTLPLLSPGQRVPSPYGYDLHGLPVTRLAVPGTEAIVLFFVASDCPISNRYIPELQRLEKEFAAQHVVLWFVYPNIGETSDAVRQHEVTYGAEEHVLLDPHHQLVALTHAKVTLSLQSLFPSVELRKLFAPSITAASTIDTSR